MSRRDDSTLDIAQDIAFQRRSWLVERIGWAAMVLVIAASLAGVLGPGLLGERTLGSSDGLHIRYDRFVRYEAPASIHLELSADTQGAARFWIGGAWLGRVHLENVNPEPEHVVVRSDGVHYTIAAEPNQHVRVTLHFEADAVGSLKGLIGQSNGPALPLEQFAYP
jgi:hypothetical protein